MTDWPTSAGEAELDEQIAEAEQAGDLDTVNRLEARYWLDGADQRDGRQHSVSVAVQPPPEDPPRQTTMLDGRHPLAGAEVANLSPALADEIGFQGPPRGVVVTLRWLTSDRRFWGDESDETSRDADQQPSPVGR